MPTPSGNARRPRLTLARAAIAVVAIVALAAAITVAVLATTRARDDDVAAEPAPRTTIVPGAGNTDRVEFSAVLRPEAPVACSPHEASLDYGDVVSGMDVTQAATSELRGYPFDGMGVVSFAYGDGTPDQDPWFLDREVYLIATAEPNHAADYRVTIAGGQTVEGYRYTASRAAGGRLEPNKECAHTLIGWTPDANSPVYLVVEGAPPGVDRATIDAARGAADGVETWIYMGEWPLGTVA